MDHQLYLSDALFDSDKLHVRVHVESIKSGRHFRILMHYGPSSKCCQTLRDNDKQDHVHFRT